MKLGKTIVAERETAQTESERLQNREKEKHRKALTTAIVVMVFVLAGIGAGVVIYDLVNRRKDVSTVDPGVTYEPTVEIIDEDGAGYVTEKMRQFVGRIERDFSDLGHKVTKAIAPSEKTREIDIYLDGREEYYKCNLDRGTAETAEDAMRMMRYLDQHKKKAKYVDVRLEERAYYK